MAGGTPGSERVGLEVQVVFFNLNGSMGLVAAGLGRRVQELLVPRDWVRRSEEPTEAALRVLTQIAGVTTAVHELLFVSLARSGGRGLEPAVTATYAAIGGVPTPHREWDHFCPASRRQIEQRCRRADAVLASLEVVWGIVAEDLGVAARLAGNRHGLFTLKDLQRVLRQVTGHQIDAANLRRRLESTEGLVEVVDHDEVMQMSKPPAVRRGRRSTWYRAGRAMHLDEPIRFENN